LVGDEGKYFDKGQSDLGGDELGILNATFCCTNESMNQLFFGCTLAKKIGR
jgi:hypothetical protein